MPVIRRSVSVPHPAEAMFDLVADVESYPEFLPFCSGATELERDETSQVASVSFAKKLPGIGKPQFTTRNRLARPGSIDVHLANGPFRKLEGTWRFVPEGEGCRAELEVDVDFGSRLVGAVLSRGLGKVCDSMVSAFVRRADATLTGRTGATSAPPAPSATPAPPDPGTDVAPL